jgi:membrane protein
MLSIVQKADQRSGGWLDILWQSVARFLTMRGLDAAASLAYYALFSLFPLALVLASLLDFFLSGEIAYERALAFIRIVFPFSGELVDQELHALFSQRGTFGVLGAIGLIWAASGFFYTLASNINQAWPRVKLRGYVHSRMIGFAMLGGMIVLMMVSILTTTLISIAQSMLTFFGDSEMIMQSPGFLMALRLASILFTYFTFVAMYRWLPNKDVDWGAVLIGAFITTLAWEAARWVFTLYLSSGLARYEFIYGSLSALIALMVWVYFGNVIALFGAYLVATLDMMNDKPLDTTPEEKAESETGKVIRG